MNLYQPLQLFLHLFFLALVLSNSAYAETLYLEQTKPIEIKEQYPLSNLHDSLIPTSALTTEEGVTKINLNFIISNTFDKEDSYLVDAETQSFELSLKYGLSENLELGLEIAKINRGSGSLDQMIESWHNFWGLPNAGREDEPSKQFLIAGTNEQGDRFELSKKGSSFADINLSGKYLLTKREAKTPWSLYTRIRIPTADDSFGSEKPDYTLGILGARSYSISEHNFSSHWGLGYTILSDTKIGNIEFEKNNLASFLSLGFLITDDLSLVNTLSFSNNKLKDIPGMKSFILYLDTSLSYKISKNSSLHFSVREDPSANTTTDVGFNFGLEISI